MNGKVAVSSKCFDFRHQRKACLPNTHAIAHWNARGARTNVTGSARCTDLPHTTSQLGTPRASASISMKSVITPTKHPANVSAGSDVNWDRPKDDLHRTIRKLVAVTVSIYTRSNSKHPVPDWTGHGHQGISLAYKHDLILLAANMPAIVTLESEPRHIRSLPDAAIGDLSVQRCSGPE